MSVDGLPVGEQDLPGDEVEECEGMYASILARSTQQNEFVRTLVVGARICFARNIRRICHAGRGFTLVYRLFEQRIWEPLVLSHHQYGTDGNS
jgi:hypothetical protein